MSTFELAFAKAKKEGLDNDAATSRAIKEALKIVPEALFDYSNYNKPRLMKAGPIAKLGTQFMTFPLQMTIFMWRNFYKSLPFVGNKQERKEAAVKFYGVMFMTFMFGGAINLWGYSTMVGLAEGLRDALRSDEDEDEDDFGNPLVFRDLDLWFREWFLPTYFGRGSSIANALGLTDEQADMLQRGIKMGPISAITDLNIGASTSLDGMWFRREQSADTVKEAWQEMALDMFGPFGSMGEQLAGSLDEYNNGEFLRSLEKLLPAFFRGIPKALRQSEEGEKTRQGNTLVNAEEYTFGKLLATTLGFQNTTAAELQKKAFLASQLDRNIKKERTKILADLDRAFQRLDNTSSAENEKKLKDALENVEDVFLEVDRFNRKNPMRDYVITTDTLKSSLKNRAERRAKSRLGISVPPEVFELIEKSGGEQ
jgi:hypothetical protein